MVDLLNERGTSVGKTLNERAFPQRTLFVEGLHVHRCGHVEYRPKIPRVWAHDSTKVVVEIEVSVRDPAGRTEIEGSGRNLLAQPRDLSHCFGDAIMQLRPLGGAVEQGDGQNRAAQSRVALDFPQGGIRLVHPIREAAYRARGHGQPVLTT